MRSKLLSAAAIAGSIMLSALAGPAVAQTSYPLVCKGGGNMRANVNANGNIVLFFDAGTVGSSQQPPAEGQCTWLDRGFRPGEPERLLLTGNPNGTKYLVLHMLDGKVFYVHAYNNRRGAMQVTRIGP